MNYELYHYGIAGQKWGQRRFQEEDGTLTPAGKDYDSVQEIVNSKLKIKHSLDSNEYELYHHGILGQKWGIRRYQNEDGTLTAEGKQRYAKTLKEKKTADAYIKLYGGKAGASDAVKRKSGIASGVMGTVGSGLLKATPVIGEALTDALYYGTSSIPWSVASAAGVLGTTVSALSGVALTAGAAYVAYKGATTLAAIKDSDKGHDAVVFNKNKK